MATTYEAIQTTTLGAAAASITLSGIAASWTDLRVVQTSLGATTAYPELRFNGDTATNYSATYLLGVGGTAYSGRQTNSSYIYLDDNLGVTSTMPGFISIDIFSYAGSTYKTTLNTASVNKNGSGGVSRTAGLWRSTAAITSITIFSGGSSFAAGTTTTLYGILKA